MKTLLQAKQSTIPAAIGIASCDPQFLQILNEAQERMAYAGRWWGSYKRIVVCASNGCIVWPREVMTVEGLNVCNNSVPLRNQFFEWQENVAPPRTAGCGRWCDERQLLDRGTTPVFREPATASTIRLYPTDVSDVGRKIILQGIDANGVFIRSNIGSASSPNWIDGEQVTLAEPFVDTVNQFSVSGLKAVQKEITNQRVLVFGVTSSAETFLGAWEPSEVNPSYRKTFLTSFPRCPETSYACRPCDDNCPTDDLVVSNDTPGITQVVIGTEGGIAIDANGNLIGVSEYSSPNTTLTVCGGLRMSAIIRREFIPARVDTDWLYVDSIPALKFAMQSLRREDANEAPQAERYWQQALRTLRSQLDAYVPPQRLQVNVEIMGTAKLGRVMGGYN